MEELSYFSDTIREQNGKAFDINVSEVYLVGLVHKLHYTIYMAQNLTFFYDLVIVYRNTDALQEQQIKH